MTSFLEKSPYSLKVNFPEFTFALPIVHFCTPNCTLLLIQLYTFAHPIVHFCISNCTLLHFQLYTFAHPIVHLRLESSLLMNMVIVTFNRGEVDALWKLYKRALRL